MYCIIKCIVQGKQARVKKRRFASSVLHSCNVKTQICVTRPQCVNFLEPSETLQACDGNALPLPLPFFLSFLDVLQL